MEQREIITRIKTADFDNNLKLIISELKRANRRGANRLQIVNTVNYQWLELYRTKSDEEIKQEKIAELERQLKELRDE